jgi:uncharacterized surface protein with fasciclin (FAS1) repeats
MATLLQALRAFGLFHVMTELLDRSGMAVLLETSTPFTLLAPTDDCFAELADGRLDVWIASHNHEAVIALLARHMLPGRHPGAGLRDAGWACTHHGERLLVRFDGRLSIAGARILQADVRCDNGLVHILDRVLVSAQPLSRTPERG